MKLARWSDGGADRLALQAGDQWYDVKALTEAQTGFGDEWHARAAVSCEPVYQDLPRIVARAQAGDLPAPLDGALVEAGLRAPVWGAGMVYCAAMNYHSHVVESGGQPPREPLFFLKPFRCLVEPGADVELPATSAQVDYEAELGVVIGKAGKGITEARAFHHIAGYTIVNDISFRDLQIRQSATGRVIDWVQGKALDSSAPIGPWTVLPDEAPPPGQVGFRLTVNGETRQDSNTNDMIFSIPRLIASISADITLRPGDVIATGTCAGVGKYRRRGGEWLRAADKIVITFDGIGQLAHGIAENGGASS